MRAAHHRRRLHEVKDSQRIVPRLIIERWRRHYNEVRPHSSLGYLTPKFASQRANAASRRATGPARGKWSKQGAPSQASRGPKKQGRSVGGMRFVVLLFLALFPAEPSHAQEVPDLAFVSEYIRELGVNERMRALGERELTEVGGNNQLAALIRSSTRIQLELGAQIYKLSGIHLKPPFEDLAIKITKFYKMKIEFHQRLIAISTSLLSRPHRGVDYGALAAEVPKITASLEYIDRSLLEATPLIFATLIDQEPDKNGKVSHLIITKAERQRLLVALSLHFGQKMDLENQSYIVSSASVLKSYLLKYKCSDEP